MRMQRLVAAREGSIGREIVTLPLLAARLAGGFVAPVATDVLYPAIQEALAAGRFQYLGRVSSLPGMPRAVLQSLNAVWRAGCSIRRPTPNHYVSFSDSLNAPVSHQPDRNTTNAIENKQSTVISTKLIDIPAAHTAWLQVRIKVAHECAT